MLAKYKCLKCDYEWKQKPEPVICPVCKHLYIKWVNYETDFVRKK